MANYRTVKELSPYRGFRIMRTHINGSYVWNAEDERGYVYESKKSLRDLKQRIYLDDQSSMLGNYLGRALKIAK